MVAHLKTIHIRARAILGIEYDAGRECSKAGDAFQPLGGRKLR
jgi:hypothetical protein